MKVKLSGVIDGMEDQTDDAGFYLDKTTGDKLLNAIRGKGAFRYLKDLIFELDVREDWYKFKHESFKKIAIE